MRTDKPRDIRIILRQEHPIPQKKKEPRMYVISMIAQPGMLDGMLVENIRNAWGGGSVDWLAPDEAAEFALSRQPDNLETVWQSCQSMGVDLVLQSAGNRRKTLLIADMDSTMIAQECIDELADVAGVGESVKAITVRAMNGEFDFSDALRERVALLSGKPESIIDEVLRDRITYVTGGDVLLATMKAHGAYAALVSGGFTAFSAQVAAHLGFDEHRANQLIIEDNILTGSVAYPILGKEAKVTALKDLTQRLGITDADVLAVGDGANDLGMLTHAGTGVALHAKPAVAAQCDVKINFGNLSALLFLQGYAKDDFVTP